MKQTIITITAFSLFSTLAFAGPDLNEAATDVCKCLEAPHNQARITIELIMKAQASGDMSQMMSAQGDMIGVIDASKQCFDDLPRKYPEIDKSDELKNKVMAIAEKQCPNPASEMSMQR